jgi:uncharacterized protein (TIGR00369 family)
VNLLAKLGTHLSGIEQLRAMMDNDHRTGMEQTLQFRLVEVGDGRVAFEGTPDVHVYNPNGTVHGGYAATMLDDACGYAVLTKLEPGQTAVTLDLKVSYHKPVTRKTGPVRAEGRVVSIGRRVAFSEARLVDSAGTLYASGSSSILVANIKASDASSSSEKQSLKSKGAAV